MADVIVEKNIPVPMQDGIRLFADVFRPVGSTHTTQPAVQTIYHDTPQPSHVLLPVILRTDYV